MSIKRALLSFQRDERAVSAGEFALVVPVLLIFLLGTIDVGLYIWSVNRAEKAVQIGTRWAVATDMIPSGLAAHSFAVTDGIPQGTVVPASAFPGITCTQGGCNCDGPCTFPTTMNSTAFNALVERMQDIESDIDPTDVTVNYAHSGLGFSGDPNGPDVAPIVTVSVDGLTYQPMTFAVFGQTLDLPNYRYSLTAEDSAGDFSN